MAFPRCSQGEGVDGLECVLDLWVENRGDCSYFYPLGWVVEYAPIVSDLPCVVIRSIARMARDALSPIWADRETVSPECLDVTFDDVEPNRLFRSSGSM